MGNGLDEIDGDESFDIVGKLPLCGVVQKYIYICHICKNHVLILISY